MGGITWVNEMKIYQWGRGMLDHFVLSSFLARKYFLFYTDTYFYFILLINYDYLLI